MRFPIKELTILTALALAAPAAFAGGHGGDGDAAKGEKTFKKCKACHQVGEGAKSKSGPVLNNLFGRAAGSVEGFKYSKSMIAAGEAGLVWDAALIQEFIEDPNAFLKEYLDDGKAKSKMTLKLKKDADRANVVAYLATFSEMPEAESAD